MGKKYTKAAKAADKPVKVDAKAANIKALTKEITDLNNEIKSLTKEITDLKNQNEDLVQQKGLTEYELSRKEQDVLNLQSLTLYRQRCKYLHHL